MLQVAICFALLMMGVEVGLLVSWLYYKDKLKERDELLRKQTKEIDRLQESDLCYAHDVAMLEDEVKSWKSKAGEYKAIAESFKQRWEGECGKS